jgi:hypothetical protein
MAFERQVLSKIAEQQTPALRDLPKLPSIPTLPHYYHEALVIDEYKAEVDEKEYSTSRCLWNIWHYFHRLKIATLFIYKFIDNPSVKDFYKEFPELELRIKLAASVIHLPSVFLPGHESQTPAILFSSPSKTFFMQYTVCTYISMKSFAHTIDQIFKLDENYNLYVANAEMFRKFIKGLDIAFKTIELSITTMKNTSIMMYMNTEGYEEDDTFYLRLFNEQMASIECPKYLTTQMGDKIWNDYLDALNTTIESEHTSLHTQLQVKLEEYFYNLLVSAMMTFNRFKVAISFPGEIDYEITAFCKYYQEKPSRKNSALMNCIEILCNESIYDAEISKIHQLPEDSADRIKRSREIYFDLRNTLHCIFYIFKNIVERKQLKRNDLISQIVAEINKLQQSKDELDLTALSAIITSLGSNIQTKSKAMVNRERGAPEVDDVQLTDAVNDEPPKIDPQVEYQLIYDKYLAENKELDDGIKLFQTLYKGLLKECGVQRQFETHKTQLNNLNKKFMTTLLNPANRIQGEVKTLLLNAEYSESCQIKLHEWQEQTKVLLAIMKSVSTSIKSISQNISNIKNKGKRIKPRHSSEYIPDKTTEKIVLVRGVSDPESRPIEENKVAAERLEVLVIQRSQSASDIFYIPVSPLTTPRVKPEESKIIDITEDDLAVEDPLEKVFNKISTPFLLEDEMIKVLAWTDLYAMPDLHVTTIMDRIRLDQQWFMEDLRDDLEEELVATQHKEERVLEVDVDEMLNIFDSILNSDDNRRKCYAMPSVAEFSMFAAAKPLFLFHDKHQIKPPKPW